MRYGITIPAFAEFSDVRRLATLAHQAEKAGWDGFFIWDHLLFGPVAIADSWVALTAIALATERVRLGPLVTPLPRRRPPKLAREVISVDHLSAGRLVLGVGIGALPFEWDYLGEEPDLKIRGDMLDEGLDVLAGLTSGKPFSYAGKHYTVDGELPGNVRGAHFLPGTLQKPRVPIWVGGTWPRQRPFRRAARWDGVVPIKANGPLTPADVVAIRDDIAEHREGLEGFDVVITGSTGGDSTGVHEVEAFAEAGATWWLESLDPWRFGWDGQHEWPAEKMRQRVLDGPPQAKVPAD